MKTTLKLFILAVILITGINKSLTAQTLQVIIDKPSDTFIQTDAGGKKLATFEVSGIQSEKQAANLEKYILGYRGVEQFSLTKNSDNENYTASGVFYNYADLNYFRSMFMVIDVKYVNQAGTKTSIENF